MSKEMFYLLRAIENPDFSQITEGFEGGEFGLFEIKGESPIPMVHHPDLKYGFKDSSELGIAIGKFFREKNKHIDSITATEMIELNMFPVPLPIIEWRDPPVLYDRVSNYKHYLEMIVAMTKELDG